MEQSFCERGANQNIDTPGACRFTENGYARRVAAKGCDIFLDPFQGGNLIEYAVIARRMIGRFSSQFRVREVTERAEAIVDRNEDYAFFGKGSYIIGGRCS